MQQAIDSADVYKHAVTGYALDRAVENLAFGDRIHQFLALRLLLVFENCAPADHHIPAFSIELENTDVDVAVLPLFQLMHGTQVNLRGGQECSNTHIYDQASLNAVNDAAGQRRFIVIGLVQIGPYSSPMGALVGNDEITVFALSRELNIDILSRIEANRVIGFHKFARRNQCLGFPADIHDHTNICDGYDPALYDLPFDWRLMGRSVLIHQLIEFFIRRQARLFGRSCISSRSLRGSGRSFGSCSFRCA